MSPASLGPVVGSGRRRSGLPMRHPVEVITTAEMADADRRSIAAGTPGTTLMDRAGHAVADGCVGLLERVGGRRVLVLCGPGNNGGDGFVAATVLRGRGYDVVVACLEPLSCLKGDAAAAAAAWSAPVVAAMGTVDGACCDLVVDALFGAGLSRPLAGEAREVVARIAASGKPVLAVDLPSGLDGDTGRDLGGTAAAAATVTFFRLKPAHLLMPGRDRCGRVTLADIGIDARVLPAIGVRLFHNLPDLWWPAFPKPSAAGHKYTRGHLLVVSGPMPTTGAARLAARGGLRIGAGLATLASPVDAMAAHAAQLTSIMLQPFDEPEGLAGILSDPRKNAVVIGPGLGHHADTRALIEGVLASSATPRAAVIDADALTLFAGEPDALGRLVGAASGPVVVTPHDGEFARLFEGIEAVIEAPSKVERARAGARSLGAILVLKGPDTVVAAPDGRAAIAGDDAPWLATAGTGDVLAGMIGGLIAQAMPAFEAACAAVWLHAAAARHFGPGLISEDLPETLPVILKQLFARDSVQ